MQREMDDGDGDGTNDGGDDDDGDGEQGDDGASTGTASLPVAREYSSPLRKFVHLAEKMRVGPGEISHLVICGRERFSPEVKIYY